MSGNNEFDDEDIYDYIIANTNENHVIRMSVPNIFNWLIDESRKFKQIEVDIGMGMIQTPNENVAVMPNPHIFYENGNFHTVNSESDNSNNSSIDHTWQPYTCQSDYNQTWNAVSDMFSYDEESEYVDVVGLPVKEINPPINNPNYFNSMIQTHNSNHFSYDTSMDHAYFNRQLVHSDAGANNQFEKNGGKPKSKLKSKSKPKPKLDPKPDMKLYKFEKPRNGDLWKKICLPNGKMKDVPILQCPKCDRQYRILHFYQKHLQNHLLEEQNPTAKKTQRRKRKLPDNSKVLNVIVMDPSVRKYEQSPSAYLENEI